MHSPPGDLKRTLIMNLILASTSPYRKELLQRLQLPFTAVAPGTDETPLPGEQVTALVARLAQAKAASVAADYPDALIIGSDQVATLEGDIFGKPGTYEAATEQLRRCSGKEVVFYTGVALQLAATGHNEVHVEPYSVKFRQLSDDEIAAYLHQEQPYDCAGSIKCEGLGSALFEYLDGRDPTSLKGLPLIALTGLLSRAGYPVLSAGDGRQ